MNWVLLAGVSVLVLFGQALDLYWLIMPELHTGPVLGLMEIGGILLLAGAFMMCLSYYLRRHAPLATGDPLLEQSRRFRLH